MVQRHLTLPHRFVCATDDPSGLDAGIGTVPLPPGLVGYWNKVSLFKAGLFEPGNRILYLDLDVVVVASIDFLHQGSGELHAIRNWRTKSGAFNSSVMYFEAGRYDFVFDRFLPQAAEVVARHIGDQDWICEQVPEAKSFPVGKIVSYKKDLNAHIFLAAKKLGLDFLKAPHFMTVSPPPGASIVVFHGKPDPEDVMDAPYGPWKRAPFIKEHWR